MTTLAIRPHIGLLVVHERYSTCALPWCGVDVSANDNLREYLAWRCSCGCDHFELREDGAVCIECKVPVRGWA